jgi:hypothetical protein
MRGRDGRSWKEIFMVKKVTALLVALALPAQVSAGPITEAIANAGRELANAQREELKRGRTRFWTSMALIGGGGVLTTLGAVEIGDDETGPEDGEDFDNSDDGEDSDGVNKAIIGGGIAAAALGGVLLFTGKKSGPVVSIRPNRVMVRQTVSF